MKLCLFSKNEKYGLICLIAGIILSKSISNEARAEPSDNKFSSQDFNLVDSSTSESKLKYTGRFAVNVALNTELMCVPGDRILCNAFVMGFNDEVTLQAIPNLLGPKPICPNYAYTPRILHMEAEKCNLKNIYYAEIDCLNMTTGQTWVAPNGSFEITCVDPKNDPQVYVPPQYDSEQNMEAKHILQQDTLLHEEQSEQQRYNQEQYNLQRYYDEWRYYDEQLYYYDLLDYYKSWATINDQQNR